MFDYTAETSKSIEETMQAIEESLKTEKFGVLWQLDMKETLQNKGFAFDQAYHVLEVCNPEAAHHVLTKNHMAGYLLPCKIVVYDDHGTTKIGMPKLTSLIQLTGDSSLRAFAQDIEDRLMVCIEKAI